jgi:hypothetical protein
MRVTFFRVAERKSPKKGRPCCLRPLRFAPGQPGVLGHGVHRRTRCAPAALRSDNCGESVHETCVSFGTHATPRPARPRRIQKGTQRTSIRAIALLGPISRAQAPRAAQAGPSAAMARVAVRLLDVRLPNPLLAAPAAGRLRGGTRVGARVLRALTRRGCPSGARQRKASSTAHPATAPTQVCPVAQRRGRRLGVAFLLGTFLWRSKEQVPRPPGRVPASAFNPSMLFTPARQGFDKLSPNGMGQTEKL